MSTQTIAVPLLVSTTALTMTQAVSAALYDAWDEIDHGTWTEWRFRDQLGRPYGVAVDPHLSEITVDLPWQDDAGPSVLITYGRRADGDYTATVATIATVLDDVFADAIMVPPIGRAS